MIDTHGSHIGRGCYNCKNRGIPIHSENLVYNCSLPQHVNKQMMWCSLWSLNNSDDIHPSPSAYTAEDAADAREEVIELLRQHETGNDDFDEEEFELEVGFAVDHAMCIALDIGKHISKEEVMEEAKKYQDIPQAKETDNNVDKVEAHSFSQEMLINIAIADKKAMEHELVQTKALLEEMEAKFKDKSSNYAIAVESVYRFKKEASDKELQLIEKDNRIRDLQETIEARSEHYKFVLETVIEAAAIDKDLKAQKRGLELTAATLMCQLVRANKNIARWEAGLKRIDPETEEDEEINNYNLHGAPEENEEDNKCGSMGTDGGDNADSDNLAPDEEM